MPVLDYSDKHDWFVMPVATSTAATERQALSRPEELRALVNAICDALRPAHGLGWIHRDLKPENLLRLDGVWTVGDWGFTRRPRGQTTNPHRTIVGRMVGTEGFAAPELSIDAHEAGPQADIYSIGQIIGWAMRGVRPQANIPLLPETLPWRHVVEKATHLDWALRPASVDDFLDVLNSELESDQPNGADPAA
jgi:serine/threonine protein kinase